jgi:hypothetical protein
VALRPVLEVRLGDRLALRKPHPCGSRTWDVVRLGADIGLVCTGCRHRVLLERAVLERRLEAFVHRGPEVETPPEVGTLPLPSRSGDGDPSA